MIDGGVPQDLILGLFLFLLYIDDHALTLEASSPVSFAVDKNIFIVKTWQLKDGGQLNSVY